MGSSASRPGSSSSKHGSKSHQSNDDRDHKAEETPKKIEDSGKDTGIPNNPANTTEPTVLGRSIGVDSETAKDLMISYSHTDKDEMRMVKDALEKSGITVWVDEVGLGAGVEFLNKIGQAIVDSKVFLSLLSSNSVTSKYCKDELSLAYVSNKPIFPCCLEPEENILNAMDFGMKLTLVPMKPWTQIGSTEFKQGIKELIVKIKAKLEELDDVSEVLPGKDDTSKNRALRRNLNVRTKRIENEDETTVDFWEKHFKDATSVPWGKFREMFLDQYSAQLKEYGMEQDDWIISLIHREINDDGDEIITKEEYESFCIVEGEERPFWVRVQEQAVENYTMKEVFSMESSVRLDAIQNLGKFKSAAVVEALLDLCSDLDPNVRTVATISLARTEASDERAIKQISSLINDKDRLVRESACLALGHMKVQKAVPKLVRLWRNDMISSVREAASVALELIGGEEAEKAIHITKVLQEEISMLTEKTE